MAKSDDVAIVGIGITSFARQPDKTGMDHGVGAVRKAVADAGCTWEDMEFAFGGSAAAGKPDTMVSRLGLTGLPFINVANGVPPVVRAQPNRNPPCHNSEDFAVDKSKAALDGEANDSHANQLPNRQAFNHGGGSQHPEPIPSVLRLKALRLQQLLKSLQRQRLTRA